MRTEEIKENEEAREALRSFITDIDCLDKLYNWTSKVNSFDVLKIANNEIRHSNVLSWLMNAKENHGLGDWFLRNIISQLIKKNGMDDNDVIKLSTMNLYSFNILREYKNIDILLVSNDEKVVITIENKVWSGEHDEQLKKYKQSVDKSYPDYNKYFVFLSPDGHSTENDNDSWWLLSYDDIVYALDGNDGKRDFVIENADKRAKFLIEDYLEILRRDIVIDKKLQQACDEIYKKHKKALDLIFEYKVDDKSKVANIIDETFSSYANQNMIIYKGEKFKTYCAFYTETMDKLLKIGDNRYYQYYIRSNNDGVLGAYLELVSKDIPDELVETMNNFIGIRHLSNDTKLKLNEFKCKIIISSYYPAEGSEYKKLVKKKKYIENEELVGEDEIRKLSETLVLFLLEQEQKLIKEYEDKFGKVR